jgi:hypothetical protein
MNHSSPSIASKSAWLARAIMLWTGYVFRVAGRPGGLRTVRWLLRTIQGSRTDAEEPSRATFAVGSSPRALPQCQASWPLSVCPTAPRSCQSSLRPSSPRLRQQGHCRRSGSHRREDVYICPDGTRRVVVRCAGFRAFAFKHTNSSGTANNEAMRWYSIARRGKLRLLENALRLE